MADTEFAKTHLREHLASLIIPPISDGFWSIHDSAKNFCNQSGQTSVLLQTFQNMLTKIPEWSEQTLQKETDRIIVVSKCTYIEDLLMGVFISYMKSFANLHYRGESNQIKINFDRPSFSKFIHDLYSESAREIWKSAYLFKTVGVSAEQQARNRQDIVKLISDSMEKIIRGYLPWEAIAKKYFGNEEEPRKSVVFEDMSDSESDEESVEMRRLEISEEADTISVDDLDEPEPEAETKTVVTLPSLDEKIIVEKQTEDVKPEPMEEETPVKPETVVQKEDALSAFDLQPTESLAINL